MDIKRSPPREGVRGGLEQFQWSQVKDQSFRDRECYLGQSLKIGLSGQGGRFYKHDWWTEKKKGNPHDTSVEDEFQTMKKYENELLEEALGIKPKRLLFQKEKVDHKKARELLGESYRGQAAPSKEINVPPLQEQDDGNSKLKRRYRRSESPDQAGLQQSVHDNFKRKKEKKRNRNGSEEYLVDFTHDPPQERGKLRKVDRGGGDSGLWDASICKEEKPFKNSYDRDPGYMRGNRTKIEASHYVPFHKTHKRYKDARDANDKSKNASDARDNARYVPRDKKDASDSRENARETNRRCNVKYDPRNSRDIDDARDGGDARDITMNKRDASDSRDKNTRDNVRYTARNARYIDDAGDARHNLRVAWDASDSRGNARDTYTRGHARYDTRNSSDADDARDGRDARNNAMHNPRDARSAANSRHNPRDAIDTRDSRKARDVRDTVDNARYARYPARYGRDASGLRDSAWDAGDNNWNARDKHREARDLASLKKHRKEF